MKPDDRFMRKQMWPIPASDSAIVIEYLDPETGERGTCRLPIHEGITQPKPIAIPNSNDSSGAISRSIISSDLVLQGCDGDHLHEGLVQRR